MIYLFLATIFSASIAIIFKYSQLKNCDRNIVTIFNYLTATIISFFMVLNSHASVFMYVANPINALFNNLKGNITAEGSYVFSLSFGLITGVFYLLAFLLYQISIKNCGVSLAGMFNKMGIIFPMIISVFIWAEYPTAIQWIGIVLMMISIIIVNISFGDISKSGFKWNLILMLFVAGFVELTNKLFQKYAMVEYKSTFMFFIFLSALVISLILCLISSKNRFSFKSAACGIAVGIPNMLSTFFIIEALVRLNATIVYPAFSAGTIVLIALISIIIYKEKLKKQDMLAIVITLLGVILVNI